LEEISIFSIGYINVVAGKELKIYGKYRYRLMQAGLNA